MAQSIGGGAAEGLESILADRYREQLEKQRIAEQRQAFGLQQQQVDLQRRRLEAELQPEPMKPIVLNGRIIDLNGGQARVLYEEPKESPKPMQVGRDDRVFDPVSGDVLLDALPEAARPMVLSPGQTAFGPDGKPLFSVPDRPRVSARLIDPTYPSAVQQQIIDLRAQHPTLESALSGFMGQLPMWQQQFPDLSPQKAFDALRQAYSGAGATNDPVDDLVSEILGGGSGQPVGAGGRGGGPGGPAGHAVETAAAELLESQGYAPTPENVAIFLSKPQNRQRLEQQIGGR